MAFLWLGITGWILLLGLELLLPIVHLEHLLSKTIALQKGFVIISLALAAFRWKGHLFQQIARGQGCADRGIVYAVERLSSIVIVIVAGMSFLQLMGVSIAPLLTLSSIGAGVVGFAARDLNANLFGGLVLSFSCPFAEGEEITLPAKGLEGIVEKVGWLMTQLRDRQQRLITAPNALFLNTPIFNASRTARKPLFLKIQVRGDRAGEVAQVIRDYLSKEKKILRDPPLRVDVYGVGADWIEVRVVAYGDRCQEKEYATLQQQIIEGLYGQLYGRGDVQIGVI